MNHEVSIMRDGVWYYEDCYCELSYDHMDPFGDEEYDDE